MAGDAEKLDAGSDPSYDLTHTRRNRNRHTRLLWSNSRDSVSSHALLRKRVEASSL